jgi:hypothetical protein
MMLKKGSEVAEPLLHRRMLRAMRRELETEFYTAQGKTPDAAKERPMDYRASSRPCQPFLA